VDKSSGRGVILLEKAVPRWVARGWIVEGTCSSGLSLGSVSRFFGRRARPLAALLLWYSQCIRSARYGATFPLQMIAVRR
jgi:hypothetical protein